MPWNCVCGTQLLQGKFCPQCGARNPGNPAHGRRGSPPGGTVANTQRGSVSAGITPAGTVAALQGPGPVSAKGHHVRQQMADLADEVFDPKQRVDCGMAKTAQDHGLLQRTHARPTGVSKYDRAVVFDTRPLAPGWHTGPSDPEGHVYQASERNILCMDVRGDECVVGSADHGLKVYDLARKREKRSLFTKKYGHSEWVTCCSYLRDGRIVSGGMDSKLCLWQTGFARCDDLMGHTASVSCVRTNENDVLVSSSYDRTLKIWSASSKSCVATLSGHKQPVMDFVWAHSVLVSGDREGSLRAWDAEQQICVGVLISQGSSQKPRGQCSALGYFADMQSSLVMAGDQSGTLRVWDLRTGPEAVHEATLHPGGALTAATSTFARKRGASNYVVTAGADKRMLVCDPRASFGIVHDLKGHKDFIYSVETHDSLALSGAGNGWVLVHDVLTGSCLFALGANKAAVRCMHAQPSRLTAAGDDGSVMTYDFE